MISNRLHIYKNYETIFDKSWILNIFIRKNIWKLEAVETEIIEPQLSIRIVKLAFCGISKEIFIEKKNKMNKAQISVWLSKFSEKASYCRKFILNILYLLGVW